MTISRKFFSCNVSLPADTATSLLALMQASPLYWTYESTARTTPSMDSILGSEAGLVPSGTVYIGSDSNVRGLGGAGGSTYQGVAAIGGQNYSLQDFGSDFGLIDPTQIYLYAQSGATIDVTFQAR